MKIALVHDFLNTWGGGEAVLKTFSEIWPEAPIYAISYDQKIIDEFLPGKKVIPSFLQNFPGMPNNYKYWLALLPRAVESFDLSNFDVVLSDSSSYAKGAITKPTAKHISYIHTPTRYLWSDYESYVQSAPIPLPLLGQPVVKMILNFSRAWDLKAAKRPDVMIANSNFIAKRIEQYYHRSADYVLFPPVDTNRFNISDQPKDYFLVVARAEPYKRTDLAILAANKLGFKLKIVGAGTKLGYLRNIAGPTVEFVGRVSDSELTALYANCRAFIFPPFEDAGITPLEAMASGRPVIAYGQGGALESVVPGVTGEFFADQTVDSLAEAIKKFDPVKYDPQKVRAHALKFDKEIFKTKIQSIVKTVTEKS